MVQTAPVSIKDTAALALMKPHQLSIKDTAVLVIIKDCASCLLKTLRTVTHCFDETAPVIYERHCRARAMKLPLSIKDPAVKC